MEAQQKNNSTSGGEPVLPGNPPSAEAGPTDSEGGRPLINLQPNTKLNAKLIASSKSIDKQPCMTGQTSATLQEKLMTSSESSQTSNGSEIPTEEANARFYKYLQQIYTTSKELDAEVVSTTNTKKEIKKLIADLAHGVKGLITWGRHTGRIRPVVNTRGSQTAPPVTRE